SWKIPNGPSPGTIVAESRLERLAGDVLAYSHPYPGQTHSRSARMGNSASDSKSFSVPGSFVPVIPGPAPFDSDPVPSALSRIARSVSGTLELKEVFSQVAEAAREVLPFEAMGVCRMESANSFRSYAVAGSSVEADPEAVVRLEDFSPAFR